MSKAYGFASWRIGWLVHPENLEAALRKAQDTIVICPPVISQYAALGALAAGAPYVRAQLRGIAAVRACVQPALAALAAEGLGEVPPAQGAFYFLPRVRSRHAPLDLAARLIRDYGVAVVPGSAFGLTAGCHLRVAYGALTPETAAEGISRLVRGLREIA
jgi:aspartate/methionine/tyrosine aminotransferase